MVSGYVADEETRGCQGITGNEDNRSHISSDGAGSFSPTHRALAQV